MLVSYEWEVYEEMKCNKCNTENPENSKFCTNCGEPLQNVSGAYQQNFNNAPNNQQKEPFYKKTWFTVLSCILFPPLGIGLLWYYKRPKRKVIRIVLTVFLCVYTVCVLGEPDVATEPVKKEEKQIESKKKEEKESKDKTDKTKEESVPIDFVSQLSEHIDKSVAEKANDIIINQIGFPEVEFREKMGETTNFEISLDGVIAVLTASDDVYRIFIPDSDYTFYEDGVVKMTAQKFKDVTIDSYEQTVYYSITKEIVESCLKSPKSADFPTLMFSGGDIAMAKSGDIVAVQSYVDAENSFGAEIRSQYIVEFRVIDLDSLSYEVIYVNINGEESGTYIEI